MDSHVSDGTAASQIRVCNPGARMVSGEILKFSVSHQWPADRPGADDLAKPVHAVLESKVLRNPERHLCAFCRRKHLPALSNVHGHWLLAKHRFAMLDGD